MRELLRTYFSFLTKSVRCVYVLCSTPSLFLFSLRFFAMLLVSLSRLCFRQLIRCFFSLHTHVHILLYFVRFFFAYLILLLIFTLNALKKQAAEKSSMRVENIETQSVRMAKKITITANIKLLLFFHLYTHKYFSLCDFNGMTLIKFSFDSLFLSSSSSSIQLLNCFMHCMCIVCVKWSTCSLLEWKDFKISNEIFWFSFRLNKNRMIYICKIWNSERSQMRNPQFRMRMISLPRKAIKSMKWFLRIRQHALNFLCVCAKLYTEEIYVFQFEWFRCVPCWRKADVTY